MNTFFENFRIQQRIVILSAMLISTYAWSGAVGPGLDTSSADRTNSLLMAGKGADVPQVARDNQDAQPEVYGKTYGEWSAKWVQWAYAGPDSHNAIQDTTGEFCDANQPIRNVWFLAGTFGGEVERSCAIPQNRALFYPLIQGGWIDCPGTGDKDLTDAYVRNIIATDLDTACQLTSTLDGVPISSLQVLTVRTQSPKFTTILPENNVQAGVCTPPLPSGKTGRLITDGYWVMLPSLSPGKHTLTLHGAKCNTDIVNNVFKVLFENGVTYHLTVRDKH